MIQARVPSVDRIAWRFISPRKSVVGTSHLHLSMAAAQPIASTFDWKQAIVSLALFVPLHSLSMLPGAQLVPPPQDNFPD